MLIGAIIEARHRATRLPYKVTRPLAGKPMLHWVIKRAQTSRLVQTVIVATPESPENADVFAIATGAGAHVVTGPEDDVLLRDIQAARFGNLDVVVRLTGDNPFVDGQVIDQAIHTFLQGGYDMVSTCRGEATYPRGIAVEVFPYEALERIDVDHWDASTMEHTTVPLYTEPDKFKHLCLPSPWPAEWREKLRLTVDTYEDYHLASILYDELGPMCRLGEVIAYCEKRPELMDINRHVQVKAVRG